MIEKLFAGFVAAACLVLLLRLAVGARRRQRLDAVARRAWGTGRRRVLWVWHWRARRSAARRAAEEAIARARRDVQREGNVYRPKSFRDPRKPH